MKNYWLIILGVFLMQPVWAQSVHSYSTKSKKAIKYYEQSTNFFIRRQYGPALELLEYALKKDANFAEAHLRVGKIYYAIDSEDQAKFHLKKAVDEQYDNPRFTDAHLLLANLHFGDQEYNEAEQLVQHLLKVPRLPQVIKNDARHLLSNIEFTQQNINNPLPYQPEPVGGEMNKLPLQYFPVLTVDQQTMIFTGRQGTTPPYDEDIYVSQKNRAGEWMLPQPISENINTPRNEGTCTVTADGRTLIFTACEDRTGLGSCDLYIAQRTGNHWSRPENMGRNINSRSWESQPSLSADGRTLYFVSDRKGGSGRRDIYVTQRQDDNTWSPAQNVGGEINTARDEVSPFIHVNGQTLYFASNGRPGFGGYDLYVSERTPTGKQTNTWSAPQNLGYPINTFRDQASLFITANGRDGYYSDEDLRNDNVVRSEIFRFELPEQIRVRYRSSYVQGTVYDAVTKEPLKAAIELIDLDAQQGISRVQSDSITGRYLMVLTEGADYALYANRDQYLFKSMTFDVQQRDEELQPVTVDIYLDPVEKGRETVLNNIFFDTDKYDIKPRSEPELRKVILFLEENPSIRIVVNGHTDNVGTADYNQKLSANRAQAIHQYLVQAGIAEERLSFRGYGAEQPIADNDTDKGRRRNRRIAFEIL